MPALSNMLFRVLIPFKNGARVKQYVKEQTLIICVLIPFKNGARVKRLYCWIWRRYDCLNPLQKRGTRETPWATEEQHRPQGLNPLQKRGTRETWYRADQIRG